MSSDKRRKCAKCGLTRAVDMDVSYHRFPLPGHTNIIKARAWAKYCWPEKNWDSVEALDKLHTCSKMLCGRHFSSSQFYDDKRQKLSRFAVPDVNILRDISNITENLFEQIEHSASRSSQGSTLQILNEENMPSTSGHNVPSTRSPATKSTQIEHSVSGSSQGSTLQILNEKNIPSTSGYNVSSPSTKSPATKSTQKTSKTTKKGTILSTINITKLAQLTPREQKLFHICKNKMKEISRLRKKVKDKKGLISTINEDINVRKLTELKVSNPFIILLQSQLRNCPKKLKGRRYTLEEKLMAIVLYKKSAACYRLLRRMFALPCQSSLNKLLNRVPLKPGINKHIFKSLKEMASKQTKEDNICTLLFDEMAIRKHLFYDVKSDCIQGYEDHGNHGRTNTVATKALVFMLAGVRKKWKQPIAFYLSHSMNADRMTVIMKEVLTECLNSDLIVVATVCDLCTVNLKVLRTLGATTHEPYFTHCGTEIVAILDPPHLLKCTRNLFLKHDVECITGIQPDGHTTKGIAKWSDIKDFHRLDKDDPDLNRWKLVPALTEQHVNPNLKQQMRVKLAAQIFSHSLASGMLTRIAYSTYL